MQYSSTGDPARPDTNVTTDTQPLYDKADAVVRAVEAGCYDEVRPADLDWLAIACAVAARVHDWDRVATYARAGRQHIGNAR